MVTEPQPPAHDPRAHANRRMSRDYIAADAGAPPLPPPGGYRGERRFPDDPTRIPLAPSAPQPSRPRRSAPSHPLGWGALGAVIVFALVMTGLLVSGEGHQLVSATMLVVQLIILALVIGSLFVPRARLLAGAALTIALVCNIGTMGATSALVSTVTGDYDGTMTPEERERVAYPGIKDMNPDAILSHGSLEQTQQSIDELSQEIRDRLSAEYGVTWVQISEAQARPERNGYGGESMLQRYIAPTWRTEQAVQDPTEKAAMMRTIDEVLYADGAYYSLYPLNEGGNMDEASLEALYGSADPATQAVWEYGTSEIDGDGAYGPSPTLMWAIITDLSNDPTGDFRAAEEATVDPGEPIEGLDLVFQAPERLSENDVDEFERRIADSPVN
ncbi:hypothetical protein [Microbacterium sp. G2-8]|uniref:hypothetical protein n=1 Tax=Microbacterium sp. G2-8 TaxID=2842454 RepID=UPI001C894159|nr:hypothetical protein [Microbacterium sp. G2-8]